MRIVQFSDSFIPIVDGVGNVVLQYAKNFGEKGHESYVVAPQTDTGYRGELPFELIDYIGVQLPYLRQYEVGAPGLDNHCKRRLDMIEADVVHVHSPFIAGNAGLSYAKKRHLPVVGSFHSRYYDDFLQVTGYDLLAEIGTKFVANFYKKCTEVWAVSESSAEALHSYGYKGEIRVMPNGTDIRPLKPEARERVTQMYDLGNEPVFLFVGQINWKKNIECILNAAARCEGSFKLVLAGRGPHEKEIARMAEHLGIGAKVILTGHIYDPDILGGLYDRADLFVFPSLYDTSGLVVREAATVGTPSVVVRGSGASEGIRDDDNGFLCDNDPASLAEVMMRVLGDPALLKRVGERAKATIPIPWSLLTDSVLERYQELCNRFVAEADAKSAKKAAKKAAKKK